MLSQKINLFYRQGTCSRFYVVMIVIRKCDLTSMQQALQSVLSPRIFEMFSGMYCTLSWKKSYQDHPRESFYFQAMAKLTALSPSHFGQFSLFWMQHHRKTMFWGQGPKNLPGAPRPANCLAVFHSYFHCGFVMTIPHICHGRLGWRPCKFFLAGVKFYRFNV